MNLLGAVGSDTAEVVRESELERLREQGLLAVARAALDPERLERRRSILVDCVLRVLFVAGPLSSARIAADIRRLFDSDSIVDRLVQSALDDAYSAVLIERRETLLPDSPEWALRDDARRDLADDAEWAVGVLDRFDREIESRLTVDVNHALIRPERLLAISTALRQALAAGSAGLYAVGLGSTPNRLRPLRFRERDALSIVGQLQPRPVLEAARRLLVAAMDPFDDFADEYLMMLASANALHGIATGRDLSERGSLTGTRLLFDTSVIVHLADSTSVEAAAVAETISITNALGGEVVVADHSIEEWRRLFQAADGHMRHHEVSGRLAVLVDNPFIRAFGRLQESGGTASWSRFRADWEDPSARLVALGIKIRPAGNHTPADQATMSRLRDAFAAENLARESQGSNHRARKGAALECDVASAAMIARWRAKGGAAAGFFVARDRMTHQAFHRAFDDDLLPMTVTPAAWALLAGGLAGDDPLAHSKLARLVANAAIAESFYSIAAGFSFEEVEAFADALSGEVADRVDIHDFVQATFDDFESEAAEDRIAQARLRGAVVRENRATRKDQRARRSVELQAARERSAEERGRQAAEWIAAETQERITRGFDETITESSLQKAAELAEVNARADLWKRVAIGGAVACVLSVALWIVYASLDFSSGWSVALAVVAQLALLLGFVEYVRGRRVVELALALVATVAISVGGLAVDRLTDAPGPPRPGQPTVGR